MKRSIAISISLCCVLIAGTARSQQPPQMPEPSAEHAWLAKFIGQWTTHTEATMGPDQAPMECRGSMTSRKLGGFWVLNEMTGEMAGIPMNGVQTIGYDEAKGKYVGTWVDSMSGYMWHYAGSLDASGKVLTLEADGPDFVSAGKLTKFQDIYEFKSADEFVMTSKMIAEDGKWFTFMSGTVTRKK